MKLELDDDDIILLAPISRAIRIGKENKQKLKYMLIRHTNTYLVYRGDEGDWLPISHWKDMNFKAMQGKDELALFLILNGVTLEDGQ